MIRSRICELLGIRYPVFQGGMAWIADGKLAAAVSEGGGLGIIAAGNAPAAYVREQIKIERTWFVFLLIAENHLLCRWKKQLPARGEVDKKKTPC